MAYITKYRFRFESVHGITYEVRLSEEGYSGSIIDRPLGKAPVIRMQQADPFRATCCELSLECQTDGEYVDLYTTDPNQFKVEVYHKRSASAVTLIWQGFVATELYSEPDIAPPYDVKITATDGLGILKEHIFEGAGQQTLRKHLRDLLAMTGDTYPYIYTASRLREYGETDNDFMDVVQINLDYMVGSSYYDVLGELLKSMRCIITYRGSYWLIIRQVDVQITSGGALSVLYSDYDQGTATTDTTLDLGKTIGQMGASGTDMWPVGYLSRSVVPAKNAVKVKAEWHLKNGAPAVDDWNSSGEASAGSIRYLGYLGGTGTLYKALSMSQFTMDVKVAVKCWRHNSWQLYGTPYIKILAMYQSSGGTTKYYHLDGGWTTESPGTDDEHAIDQVNSTQDPNLAQEISVTIPNPNDSYSGNLVITVVGHLVDVCDISVHLVTMRGYEDNILIDNGARGSAEDLSITGGREISSFLIPGGFVYGVWNNSDTHQLITEFSDGSRIGRDWMSLTALAYAKEFAVPRIEITGKLDNPYANPMQLPPMFVKSHGTWAIMSTYDWQMESEDIDFKAVTLPTASLSVSSENITSMAGNNGASTSSGGTSGGGGGGYVLPIASANDLGGIKVGTGLSIDASGVLSSSGGGSTVSISDVATSGGEIAKLTINGTTTSIKNRVEWGSSGSNKAELYVNNSQKTVLLDGWSELPSVSSSDNGKVLKVVSGQWTKGTVSGGDSLPMLAAPFIEFRRGYTKYSPQQPITPVLYARHPAIEEIGSAEFVLMMYSKRRGRNSRKSRVGCFARNGWGAAQGKSNHAGFTWTTDTKSLTSIREYILHNYIAIAGEPRPSSMTYATFQGKTADAGFSGLYSTSAANFKYKTKRRFGLAVRWENPEWTALGLTGTIDDSFTEYLQGNTSTRRWIYTDVAEFTVHVHRASLTGSPTGADGYVIGFELGG